MQGLGNLGGVFLDKTAGDIDQFLGVAVGVFDPQHGGRPHFLLKFCKKSDIGAAEGIDGLPVIAHSDHFCIADFAQGLRQIKALTRNILIFVYNDVFEGQPLLHLGALAQGAGGVVDHVLKVHRLHFLQDFLILEVAGLADIQKQLCAHILRGFLHDCKLHLRVAVGLEVGDKAADQQDKPANIAVSLILQDLPEDLLLGTGMNLHTMRPQLLLQMLRQRPAVPVAGEGIDQFRPVPAVEQDFLIDGVLIGLESFFIIAAVLSVPRDSKVLDVDFSVALPDQEIRCIWLSRQFDVIAVDGLIDIVDSIAVKEIGDLHLLGGSQDLVADGDFLFSLRVHDLGAVFVQFTAHGGIAHLRDPTEKSLQVLLIQRGVKIRGEKEDQAVHHPRILQNFTAQIVPHDKELFVGVHDIDPLRILHMQNGIARRVEGTDGTGNPQIFLYARPQFLHGLVGKGNDENLLRLNSLSVHQIFNLGRHGGRFSRPGASNDQTVVLIRQDHPPLGVIEPDLRIHCIEHMVQVVLLLPQRAVKVAGVVGTHPGRPCGSRSADALPCIFPGHFVRFAPRICFLLFTFFFIFFRCGTARSLLFRSTAQIQDLFYSAGRMQSVPPAVQVQHSFLSQDLQILQIPLFCLQQLLTGTRGNVGMLLIQLFQPFLQAQNILQILRKFRQRPLFLPRLSCAFYAIVNCPRETLSRHPVRQFRIPFCRMQNREHRFHCAPE